MPIWYSNISTEHLAVRESCGLFDISHMGRVLVDGRKSMTVLDYLIPSDLSKLETRMGIYSTICNKNGGVVDDIIIFRLEDKKYLVVVNAANLSKDLSLLVSNNSPSVNITDMTTDTAMFALQGPTAESLLDSFLDNSTKLRRFGTLSTSIFGVDVIITRTGYTGEDGFEIILHDPSSAIKIWESIILHGKSFGLIPCGLGARDTLRIEAGLCLYGNELNEKITPVEAGLEWIVSSDKSDFIGKEKIMEQIDGETKRSRIGLNMDDRGIPRDGFQINNGSDKIGYVTSGTYSPLLKRGIAMGYVESEHCKDGKELTIEITGDNRRAVVTRPPFYDKSDYGWKRRDKALR